MDIPNARKSWLHGNPHFAASLPGVRYLFTYKAEKWCLNFRDEQQSAKTAREITYSVRTGVTTAKTVKKNIRSTRKLILYCARFTSCPHHRETLISAREHPVSQHEREQARGLSVGALKRCSRPDLVRARRRKP